MLHEKEKATTWCASSSSSTSRGCLKMQHMLNDAGNNGNAPEPDAAVGRPRRLRKPKTFCYRTLIGESPTLTNHARPSMAMSQIVIWNLGKWRRSPSAKEGLRTPEKLQESNGECEGDMNPYTHSESASDKRMIYEGRR